MLSDMDLKDKTILITGATAGATPVVTNTPVTITGQQLDGATVTIGGRVATVLSRDAGGTSLVVGFPYGVTWSPAQIAVRTVGGTTSYGWSWR